MRRINVDEEGQRKNKQVNEYLRIYVFDFVRVNVYEKRMTRAVVLNLW